VIPGSNRAIAHLHATQSGTTQSSLIQHFTRFSTGIAAFTSKKTGNQTIPSPDARLRDSRAIEAFLAHLVPAMPLRVPEDYAVGINLVRVVADNTNMGSPAPGLHQDGYDFSCHVNVARQNVSGGASLLASGSKSSDVILEYVLQPNEFIFFNDRELYHTATPITQRIAGEETWRDMVIIDLIKR
jgi:hypothetical protein